MDSVAIGERLKTLRGERSRAEVASAIGVTVSAVAMYERGERMPRDDTKVALAKLYKTSVAKLFYS